MSYLFILPKMKQSPDCVVAFRNQYYIVIDLSMTSVRWENDENKDNICVLPFKFIVYDLYIAMSEYIFKINYMSRIYIPVFTIWVCLLKLEKRKEKKTIIPINQQDTEMNDDNCKTYQIIFKYQAFTCLPCR